MIDFKHPDKELLARINSATKYPSILTYHGVNPENGSLLENQVIVFDDMVFATEKLDGANARIILLPDLFIIGSRTELLTAQGDVVQNPAENIVDAVYFHAMKAGAMLGADPEQMLVLYGEVYGSKTQRSWKKYGAGLPSFRLFDAAFVPCETLTWPRERIAAWRDNDGQRFLDMEMLGSMAGEVDIPLVPEVKVFDPTELPRSLQGMRDLLGQWAPGTRAAIDQGAAVPGAAEGLVLRTADRRYIAKARFEDYDRTLRKRS